MKNHFLALTAVVLCLVAFTSAFAAQHGGNVCACSQDANYVDDGGTSWPSCVVSFGISWSPTQEGRCNKPPACTNSRPCQGNVTMSGSGTCTSWGVDVYATGSGQLVSGEFPGSFSVPSQYSITCGNEWRIDWYAAGVHLGTTHFKCKDCQGGIPD